MKYYEVVYRHPISNDAFSCRLHAMGRLDAYIQVSKHGNPIFIRRIS